MKQINMTNEPVAIIGRLPHSFRRLYRPAAIVWRAVDGGTTGRANGRCHRGGRVVVSAVWARSLVTPVANPKRTMTATACAPMRSWSPNGLS